MFYYFYILQSEVSRKFYLGFTSNLKERIKHHNLGKDKATKPYIPYKLIFFSGFRNKYDALNCEKYFKTTAGWRRIKRMLEKELEAAPA